MLSTHAQVTAAPCTSCSTQRRGKKLLVLDPKISAYLGFLTEITLLREHGVERYGLLPRLNTPPALHALAPPGQWRALNTNASVCCEE